MYKLIYILHFISNLSFSIYDDFPKLDFILETYIISLEF